MTEFMHHWMRPAGRRIERTYSNLAQRFRRRLDSNDEVESLLCCILFLRPESTLAEQLLPRLSYLHSRSGDSFDISCAGYSRIVSSQCSDDEPIVTIDDQPWFFNVADFTNLVEELEGESRWKYHGETEILLATAKLNPFMKNVTLDYKTAIHCRIDRMIDDKVVPSLDAFFENLISYCSSNPLNQSTTEYRLQAGGSALKQSLWTSLLSLLPKSLGDEGKKISHFVSRDFERSK